MNKNTSIYRRNLSSSEHLYLAFQKICPPFCIQMLVEGTGNIEVEPLQAAVAKASDANPGSRLILKRNLKKSYWLDSGISPPVQVVNDTGWSGFDFKNKGSLTVPHFYKTLDYISGPVSEVILIKGKTTSILFRSFHGVMDARGLLFWVEEIFRVLRNEPVIGTNTQLNDSEMLKSFELNENDVQPAKEITSFNLRSGSPTGKVSGTEKNYLWGRKKIQGNYPALVSQIAFILSEENYRHFENISKFMIPVDLRHNFPNLYSTANLSNPIFVEVKQGETWPGIYHKILTMLRENKEKKPDSFEKYLKLFPVVLLAKGFGFLSSYLLNKNRFLGSGIISNIGKIVQDNFNTKEFSCESVFFLPIDIPASPVSIVTTENKNFIELTVSIPAVLGSNGRLEALMETIEQGLLSFQKKTVKEIRPEDQAGMLKFNSTRVDYPDDKMIHQLFELQVEKTPGSTALFTGNKIITYRELNEKANSFALSLSKYGTGQVIGLLAGHSPETLIAILGILKSGNAYLPIDTEYPAERVHFILNDSSVKLLITDKKIEIKGEKIIYLTDLELLSGNKENLNIEGNPENPAYLIYTSGSTGKPKGTVITHKNLVNYAFWAKKIYLSAEEKFIFPLFTSIAFDLTITSIFVPLISGNSIELYDSSPNLFIIKKIINEGKANIIKLTPTHLKMLKETGISFSRIKKIIVGGENLSTSLAREIYDKFGQKVEIFNEYGPTETTVGCMVHLYNPAVDTGKSVPIGKPADNFSIYLLNEDKNPVPPGSSGEIYIAGDGVAAGYLNRPELTREKFIDNPFIPGTKMYRTGDLGLWLTDFRIEYLGRVDEQLKIRGYRIEPGEVENLLLEYPGVTDCIVVLKDRQNIPDQEKLRFLTAYYISGKEINADDLRKYLATKVPPYMIPSYFIAITKMPVTINGKIDKNALPYPEDNFLSLRNAPAKVEDQLTINLIEIIAEVLSLPVKKMNENLSLFELGFDSFSLVVLFSRIEKEILQSEKKYLLMGDMEKIIIDPKIKNLVNIIKCIKENNLNS